MLFYLTAQSERVFRLIVGNVVWFALPADSMNRTKVRDYVKEQLSADGLAKRSTIVTDYHSAPLETIPKASRSCRSKAS